MKFDGNVHHIVKHRLTYSRIFDLSRIFKMEAMTSFQTERCCHLVSQHEASSRRLYSSVDSSWFIVYMHSYTYFIPGSGHSLLCSWNIFHHRLFFGIAPHWLRGLFDHAL